MAEIPYETNTPSSWAEEVNSWPWAAVRDDRDHPLSWSKGGSCPRCHHKMSLDIGIVFGIIRLPPLIAYCNCGIVHETGETGCGQSAEIERPRG
jgi:hypothetical protein